MLKLILEHIFLRESLKLAKDFALKENIPIQTFDKFNALDTTPTKKLIHQILKWYIFDVSLKDKIDELKPKIETFIKFTGGRIKEAIETFKTFEEFSTFITPFLDVKTKSEKKDELEGQYRKIFENDTVLIVLPFTHKASCIYGAHTKWCTTSKEAEMWNTYASRGCTIYYIINKLNTNQNDPMHKMSFVVEKDGSISQRVDAVNSMRSEEIKKWLTDNGCNLEIFVPQLDAPELKSINAEKIKSRLNEYKTKTEFEINHNNKNDYDIICADFKLDEIFPILKTLTIGDESYAKLPLIPKSVTDLLLRERCIISDLKSINKRNIKINITASSDNGCRKIINCDSLSAVINFTGYADYFNRDRTKLKIKELIDSPFKELEIITSHITDYGGFKNSIIQFIAKCAQERPKAVVITKKRVTKKSPNRDINV